MAKWLKWIAALPLLPFCAGAAKALWRVVGEMGRAETIWVPMAAGAACWWAVYLLMPIPMRFYVLGHELTHAIWTWLFGGRVKRLRVFADGGHVIVTRSNFLIALSPYFIPFYAVVVVLTFAMGHRLWGWADHLIWFHLLIGAAYSFHVTLTWHILQTRQSDITSQGYLFSAVIIFLGNACVLLIGLPLITAEVRSSAALRWWMEESWSIVLWMVDRVSVGG